MSNLNPDFKLKELTIKNFKVFTDFFIDFERADLIVLGGPNGYGKTTIFDAIELAFTGNIDRFESIEFGKMGYRDVLVAKDQNKPVIIELKVTKKAENEEITIIRKLDVLTSSHRRDRRIGNFENLWDLSLKLGDQEAQKISQEDLEKELGQEEIKKYYNLFYYVQQEDTSQFLKKSERDRLEEISRLFGTKIEKEEQKKLENAKNKINTHKTTLKKDIDEMEQTISYGETELMGEEVKYNRLLPWTEKEWDLEKLLFSDAETKDKYINELNKISPLLRHKEHFLAQKEFTDNCGNKETIKALLVGAFFKDKIGDKIDEMKRRLNTKRDLDISSKILESEDMLAEGPNLNREFLEKTFHEFDFNTFFVKIQELNDQQDNLDGTKKIIRELLYVRTKLLEKFKLVDTAIVENNKCPLCGFDWSKREKLFDEIGRKTAFFKSLLSSEEKTFHQKKEQFESQLLNPLSDKVKNEVKSPEFIISEFLYKELLEAKKKREDLKRLGNWLKEKQIDYSNLLVKTIEEDLNARVLENRVNEIIERIKGKAPPPPGQYEADDQKFKFADVFFEFFDDAPENLKDMKPTSLEQKKQYIERQYFQSLDDKKAELENLKEKLSKLDEVEKNLTDTINIYKKQISTHRQRIIKDIEIPFFIYSGKILQSIGRENTIGIFIKDPSPKEEELKNIRFVTKWETDHDVINTTSSGQLAGIVIALTLAMNKIYSKGLESLFIDDPVQTMDDINMISLVELLRNDFEDKQLFLSTHESDKEKYFLYKYQKYGREVKLINCMKESAPKNSKVEHSKA